MSCAPYTLKYQQGTLGWVRCVSCWSLETRAEPLNRGRTFCMGTSVHRDLTVKLRSVQRPYIQQSKLSAVDPKYSTGRLVWVAVSHPGYMSPSDPVAVVTTNSVSLKTLISDRWSVFLHHYKKKRTGKEGEETEAEIVCVVLALPTLFATVLVSAEAPKANFFLLALSFHFSTENSLKLVRLPTRQNPHMPCHCFAWVTLQLSASEKRWGWVSEGDIWDCTLNCGWPMKPIISAATAVANKDSQNLGILRWEVTGVRGWGLAKKRVWYIAGHFTQQSIQEVSHQRCQRQAATLS